VRGGITITAEADGCVFTNPNGRPLRLVGLMMATWPDIWLSPSANANLSRLSFLR
jgi:hypothetical protein